jgi:hypothetical protein
MKVTEPLFDHSFFDPSLLDNNNLKFGFTEPKLEKQVFGQNTRNYEGNYTFYSYILQTDDSINLFYNAKPKNIIFPGGIENRAHLCLLNSQNGLDFTRPSFNFVKTNDDRLGYNNVLIKGFLAENFPIFIDPQNLLGEKFVSIFRVCNAKPEHIDITCSHDFRVWNTTKSKQLFHMNDELILKGLGWTNYVDTLSTTVFNPYNKTYYYFTRYNKFTGKRHIQYSTSKDLQIWSKFKEINFVGHDKYNIYVPTISMYPDSPYFIGFPPILAREKDYSSFYATILFSKDGHTWRTHPTLKYNPLLKNIPSHCIAKGIAILNDFFYIYVVHVQKCEIYCYSIPKHRLFYLFCSNTTNTITSLPLKLSSNSLTLNFKTNTDGFIVVNLLYNNKIIDTSEKLYGNYTNCYVKWKNNHPVDSIDSKYSFQFIMNNVFLYSFTYI